VEVESEAGGIAIEWSEVVDVFGTTLMLAMGSFESFDDVASGREGSADFGFDEREEPGSAGLTGGGLHGREGCDNLEEPSW